MMVTVMTMRLVSTTIVKILARSPILHVEGELSAKQLSIGVFVNALLDGLEIHMSSATNVRLLASTEALH